MNQRMLRGCVALTSAVAVASTLALAGQADAAEAGIRTPTMSVVCSKPHHGRNFDAVRFVQRGRWAAGMKVTAVITKGDSERPRATIHAHTGAAGRFHVDRVVVRQHTSPWRTGVRYTWTTVLTSESAATARRGSLELRGSC